MLNHVALIGHLGADPEVKSVADGGRLANLRLATTEKWRDRSTGEVRERTEWHSITVRGDGLVGVVDRYARKGGRIYVEGKLSTRKWQDQEGRDRYTTEVVVAGHGGRFLLLDRASAGQGGGSGGGAQGGGSGGVSGGGSGAADMDDDIPF